MSKILISLPDQLNRRFKAIIPRRKRSQFLVQILEKAIIKREEELYECAKLVEEDEALSNDMRLWDVTLDDCLDKDSK